MLIEIDESSPVPLYAQIAASVRRAIAAGHLSRGDRLPATRDLAAELGVNMHTVQRAYGLLRDEGVLQLRQGRGAVVAGDDVERGARLRGLVDQLLDEARSQGLTVGQLVALMEEKT
jgi:GntR family transcriptional regulator